MSIMISSQQSISSPHPSHDNLLSIILGGSNSSNSCGSSYQNDVSISFSNHHNNNMIGQQQQHQQQQQQNESVLFSWCDFPCESEYYFDNIDHNNVQCNIESHTNNTNHHQNDTEYNQESSLVHHSVPQTTKTLYHNIKSVKSLSESSLSFLENKNKNNKRKTMKRKSSLGRKSVQFSNTFEVRNYSIIMGDHPYCIDGYAIQCGWEYNNIPDIIQLDTYELNKQQRGIRYPKDFYLTYHERKERLS